MAIRKKTNGSTSNTVTRRQVLKGFGVGAAGLALAACAPGSVPTAGQPVEEAAVPAAEPANIRYQVRTGSQGDYYQLQADAFADAQDEVRITLEQTPAAEYEQKLTTLVAGGELGDGFWAAPFVAFYPLSARDISLDMKPLVEADGYDLDIFFPAAIQQLTWDGKLTGWPQGAHPGWTSMFTNLDVWEAAGADTPQWEWTYADQWLEAIIATSLDEDGDGETDRFGFQFDYNPQAAYTFIKSWGGDWINPDDLATSAVSADACTEALMFMHDLVYRYAASPKQGDIIENMFHNGFSASWAHGIWHVSTAAEIIQDQFRWQVFPMPAGPGGRGSFVGIDTMCISSATEHPDAVFEWHKWMTTKEAGLAQMDHGFTPPVRFDAWEDPKLADDPNFQVAFRWMEAAQPTTFPANARVQEFTSTFTQAFQAFMLEADDPMGKLEELDAAIQSVLDKPLL